MTREEKADLAFAVMSQMADLLEFPEILSNFNLSHVDRDEVAQTLRSWAAKLPGGAWDDRLGPSP